MALKLNRKQQAEAAVVRDWREDPALVAAKERLAQLDQEIPKAADRIKHEHARRVTEEDEHLSRAELEVLAGRASDSDLAAAQARHLDAKIAHAKAQIAYEDSKAEKARLEADVIELRKQAKIAAHAYLRAQALSSLRVLREHVAAAIEAQTDLRQTFLSAERQFSPYALSNKGNVEQYVPDNLFESRAGIEPPSPINPGILAAIDKAIAHLDPQP